MRYWFCALAINILILVGCGSNHSQGSGVPGLYRWSGQPATTSHKVILFIHGRRGKVPTQREVEELFSPKILNINELGKDKFGCPTSDRAQFWFCAYYPQQPVSTIVADLASAIRSNRELSGAEIAVIAHSEGGVIAWLLDQQTDLIKGGVLLGAPMLSTPLAHPDSRDSAIRKIVPASLADLAISKFESGVLGTEYLVPKWYESCSAKSNLLMFAGQIDPMTPSGIGIQLMMSYSTLVNDGRPNREVASFGALLIDRSDWSCDAECDFPDGYQEEWCHQSDGVVPVASAIWGAGINYRIWPTYDHYDLLSGQGSLELDIATLDHLDQVLHLMPESPSSDVIPSLPEIDIFTPQPLANARFVYVLNNQLVLANESWQTLQIVSAEGVSSFPQFSSDGSKLVWTQTAASGEGIYFLQNDTNIATIIVSGSYASFSPDDDQLVWQQGQQLMTRDLSSNEDVCVLNGINLACPPIWITSGLIRRIYFVNRDSNGSDNLYWVSPAERGTELTTAALVQENCSRIFPTRGELRGVVAVKSQTNASGQIDSEKIWLVCAPWHAQMSLEIAATDGSTGFSYDGPNWMLQLNEGFGFSSAAVDWEQGLYLEGIANGQTGIHYLDVWNLTLQASPLSGFLSKFFSESSQPEVDLSTMFMLVVPDGSQLDIKTAPE